MKRQTQSEADRAASERARLVEQETPTLDAAAICDRCYGTNVAQVLVDGYVTAKPCDHHPLPPEEEIPF